MPQLLTNSSAAGASAAVTWGGGNGEFDASGTFNGTTLTLQSRNGDGTFSDIAGTALTASGKALFSLTPTQIRVNVTGGSPTSVTAAAWRRRGTPSGGGGSGTVDTINSKAPDGSGNVVLTAQDVGAWALPLAWAAASNTPALTSDTAPNGAVYYNTSPGTTTLGTAINGITKVQFGDKLAGETGDGKWTLIPANQILGPFASLAAIESAFPSATTPSAAFAWYGAGPTYSLAYNSQNGWTSLTAGSSSTTTNVDLFGGNSFMMLPLGLGTTTWSAVGASTSLAQVGTSTARSGQLASLGYLSRIGIVSTAAANSNAYGTTSSSLLQSVAPSTSALFPTQRCRVVFCSTDSNASSRMGAGFFSTTPTATVEPSTLVNNAMFAADSTDSQLTFMTCSGTGTATKTTLNGGTGFPSNTNGADIYDAYIEFVGGTTRQINYCITNRATGVKASGSVTATLPDAGTNLRVGAYRNTAANTTAAGIDLISMAGGGYAQMGPTS